MLKVGLTGGIGSGKTSVSNLFADHGIPVIDTDVIAHDLVNHNASVLQEISDIFGEDVLQPDGELDRKKLASIVFNNEKNRQLLEKIFHPKIDSEINRQLKVLGSGENPPDYVIIVIPLLIEASYQKVIDRILAVIADEELRIERVQQRDNRSQGEIRAIINNQVDDEKRLNEADDIIENNDNIKDLDSKIEKLHEIYLRLSRGGR